MFTTLRRWNNRCPDDSSLRESIDQGLENSPVVARHLESCSDCSARFVTMQQNARFADDVLDQLKPDKDEEPDTWQSFNRLMARTDSGGIKVESGVHVMQRMWGRRGVRTAAGLAGVIAIVMMLAISPVGSAAGNLMDRFRVQKFAAITVSKDDFMEFGASMMFRVATSDMQSLDDAISDIGTIDSTFDRDDPFANVQEFDNFTDAFDNFTDAEAAYGDFLAPDSVPDQFANPKIYVSEAGTVTATVNTAKLQTLIDELNLPIYEIPDATNYPELVFTVEVPSALVLHYEGNTPSEAEPHEGGLFVAQMESPTLITPDSLDMDRLREDILQLPGLPPDFVAQLRAIQDWESTLIIPVPDGASSKDVTVQGQPGLLIEMNEAESDTPQSAVIWEKDGILYIVGGEVNGSDALDIANSLS